MTLLQMVQPERIQPNLESFELTECGQKVRMQHQVVFDTEVLIGQALELFEELFRS